MENLVISQLTVMIPVMPGTQPNHRNAEAVCDFINKSMPGYVANIESSSEIILIGTLDLNVIDKLIKKINDSSDIEYVINIDEFTFMSEFILYAKLQALEMEFKESRTNIIKNLEYTKSEKAKYYDMLLELFPELMEDEPHVHYVKQPSSYRVHSFIANSIFDTEDINTLIVKGFIRAESPIRK